MRRSNVNHHNTNCVSEKTWEGLGFNKVKVHTVLIRKPCSMLRACLRKLSTLHGGVVLFLDAEVMWERVAVATQKVEFRRLFARITVIIGSIWVPDWQRARQSLFSYIGASTEP